MSISTTSRETRSFKNLEGDPRYKAFLREMNLPELRTTTMSTASCAVFLSYASEDAPAARRIAEALRAAGVEVWFDREELRGGTPGIKRSASRPLAGSFLQSTSKHSGRCARRLSAPKQRAPGYSQPALSVNFQRSLRISVAVPRPPKSQTSPEASIHNDAPSLVESTSQARCRCNH
jgi:TIR domain-containing protein